ncbi:MAG: methyltransferase domain-containing protein [Acidobacteria bacterium]|nr:methyltransferase domain-containing protein [Acidobacteriota bacterium]
MARDIDALTASTLKHLRERWWDDKFTSFLRERLLPRPGNRILDVGCGVGTAEVSLGLLQLSQVRLYGVDRLVDRLRQAVADTRARNIRARFATGDACALPFKDAVFDSTFCVAVLQHIADLENAVRELARVTRSGGRVLVVEPDNAARYWFSSTETGKRAFELGGRFFTALALARGDTTDPSVGPKLPAILDRHKIEPVSVHLFPVSVAHLGAPAASAWASRREAIVASIGRAESESIKRLGADYLKLLDRYAEEAASAGSAFVEIQNTMLFATMGVRRE